MHVMVIGGAGMIGRKLLAKLFHDRSLADNSIDRITVYDIVSVSSSDLGDDRTIPVEMSTGDLSQPGEADRLVATQPDVIYHLAAIVSGEAEQDFDKGYRVNLQGTWNLLEAIRQADYLPKLIFASSIAVYGDAPQRVPDNYQLTPLTSYGTQKAICELLVSDYSRKNFVDGYALRLPTICVRPGKPNKAASGFFSNIIREPLVGQEAILPVSEDVLHWFASPRAVVHCLLHAATLDGEQVGPHRAFALPGVAATVGQQIEALRRVAGDDVVAKIQKRPDPFIQKMVAGWPKQLEARRGRELGFPQDEDFESIIRAHIEDELTSR